jgi:hypothetical protein
MDEPATLEQAIKQLVPNSLDDIIRAHRDEFSMRLANVEDVAALPKMISMLDKQKPIRATIQQWRIVCFARHAKLGGNALILTGTHEARGCNWATSFVKAVDFENGLVLTENSVYKLGIKGEGEPHLHILLHICHALHKWGYGDYLGVLSVFY